MPARSVGDLGGRGRGDSPIIHVPCPTTGTRSGIGRKDGDGSERSACAGHNNSAAVGGAPSSSARHYIDIMAIESVNPATGETLRTFEPLMARAEIEAEAGRGGVAPSGSWSRAAGRRARGGRRRARASILESGGGRSARIDDRRDGQAASARPSRRRRSAPTGCRYYAEHGRAFLRARDRRRRHRRDGAGQDEVRFEPLGAGAGGHALELSRSGR